MTGSYAFIGLVNAPAGKTAFDPRISTFLRIDLLLSLAVNVMCTCLVAFRVWRATRDILPHRKGHHPIVHYDILAVIVESAAIYSVSLATYIVIYSLDLNAHYTLYLINAQIMVRVFLDQGIQCAYLECLIVYSSYPHHCTSWTGVVACRDLESDDSAHFSLSLAICDSSGDDCRHTFKSHSQSGVF